MIADYHVVSDLDLIIQNHTIADHGIFNGTPIHGCPGADFHIGLDAKHDDRVGELIPPNMGLPGSEGTDKDSIAFRTMSSCKINGTEPRSREWRAAEIPAAGGTGNARSVARVHSAMACGGSVDGVRLLSQAGVEKALEEQSLGVDHVFGMPVRFGMGFGLVSDDWPLSPNERSCFWGGWGGSLAVIDLDARMSVAYVMNRMHGTLVGDARGGSLVMTALAAAAE